MSDGPAPEAPAPSRPLLRWFGGKWALAPWIISLMPLHECYTEAFAGATSVLMRKPRSRVDVLGNLDYELLCLFRVVRDVRLCGRLSLMLLCTLYSEAEYELARQPAPEGDDVERARRMIVRHAMGRSGDTREASGVDDRAHVRLSCGRPHGPIAVRLLPLHHRWAWRPLTPDIGDRHAAGLVEEDQESVTRSARLNTDPSQSCRRSGTGSSLTSTA